VYVPSSYDRSNLLLLSRRLLGGGVLLFKRVDVSLVKPNYATNRHDQHQRQPSILAMPKAKYSKESKYNYDYPIEYGYIIPPNYEKTPD